MDFQIYKEGFHHKSVYNSESAEHIFFRTVEKKVFL
jgi:hypothetical protein